ncbi:APC family permease [Pseudoflavitalea sp. G-6-1-2]|uniref:APC family permease n=1 Tax=Pseudoflavitalea sp. G-6-1-2 TaxID=2728841 RepID=UPI00146B8885|nr:APC family permease [Pseudoflavitalea sp. G-6-1-2]NML19507.1 APC family permease [Pseudoflavitalea sp. G-6-1-2]
MKSAKLTLFDLTMIVIGLVIGMGIFRTASDSAKDALTPTIFFAAWIVGGLVALCGALTYAEIGSRHPVTGGYYKIFSYAYHPSLAFSINCIILVSNASSLSAVALIGSGYIGQVLFHDGASDAVRVIIAIIAIIVFYGVNLMGLKMSSRTQNVLMLIKISMIVMLIAGLCFPSLYVEQAPVVTTGDGSISQTMKAFGLSLVAISFTYGGYQQTINFGNEVKNASRSIPKGIFIGITCIIVLYLLVNYSYYKLIGFEQLKTTKEIASVIAGKMFGQTGSIVFSGLLFLSVLAYVNVLLMSNPRVMYAMSDDGVLPAIFKKQSAKREVLVTSLTVFAATCIVVLFFAKKFEEILSFTIFLDCFGMAMSAGAIFVLRKRTKHLDGTGIYTMKLYPLMPVIFILAYTFVGVSIAIDKPRTALVAIGVLLTFIVLYFLMRRPAKPGATQAD